MRIKRLRLVFIGLVFGWPVFGIVAFQAGARLPFIMIWFLAVIVMGQVLWWTRCPRCEGFFFSRLFFFVALIEMFRRRCCQCGLDIRQLRRGAEG
jgi:hypothetical protein